MHKCDKEERIRILEIENAELKRKHNILTIIFTPKIIVSLTIALSILIQTIANSIRGLL